MAAISYVFTIARVAVMLGEDEDWLHEISLELELEDGKLAVYGIGEEYTPAFTEFGLENLCELIRMHRESAERCVADPAEWHSMPQQLITNSPGASAPTLSDNVWIPLAKSSELRKTGTLWQAHL